MNTINILISINKDFLENAEEMLFSILYYSSKNIDIYLMYQDKELNKDNIIKISNFVKNTKKGRIIPIKFDTRKLTGMPIMDNEGKFFGMEAYSRLFCAYNLPKEVDKILYLDVDIICTGDISELYDISFEGKMWIACEDRGINDNDLKRLGLPENYRYINSGMLLINIEKLIKQYKEKDIQDLIKKNKEVLIYPDQDFINKIFANDIKIIDSKYNLIAKDTKYRQLEFDPLIIHYAGSIKPWDDNVSRFDKEFLEPYYEILRMQNNTKKQKLEEILRKHSIYGYNNE